MNDKKIIEEMARLDGLKQPFYVGDKVYNKCGIVPDYPNSHDACQRVIDGIIDLGHCIDFVINLGEILRNEDNQPSSILLNLVQEEDVRGLSFSIYNFLRATPRQKCEAILKTYGQWEDE